LELAKPAAKEKMLFDNLGSLLKTHPEKIL
jgi:hypothetical protein